MKQKINLVSYGIPKSLPPTWILMVNSHELINRIYYIITEGAGYIQNSKKIPFKKGYFYFIPSNANIEFYIDEPDFTHAYIDFLNSKVYSRQVLEIKPADYPVLESQIEVFMRFLEQKNIFGITINPRTTASLYHETSMRIKSILSAFLYDIDEILMPLKENPAIINSIEYIKSNYINNIKTSELAKNAAFSTNHFIRLFEEYTGLTPHQYIKKLRLDMALEYLKTDLSITEIAEKCGYLTVSSFSNAFKKSFGQKPSNFREDANLGLNPESLTEDK